MSKPRVITEFEKLEEELKQLIKLSHPYGFEKNLISFKNHKKHLISALPYETEDRHFLIKMTREKANAIIIADDDYNENGILKTVKKEEYEANYKNLVKAVAEQAVVKAKLAEEARIKREAEEAANPTKPKKTRKKRTTKAAADKKTTAAKPAAKKTAVKKIAAKKPAAKKTAAKKSTKKATSKAK